MMQDILTYTSVIAAFSFAFYSLGKTIYNSYSQKETPGCSGGCISCEAKKSLLKGIDNNKLRLIK